MVHVGGRLDDQRWKHRVWSSYLSLAAVALLVVTLVATTSGPTRGRATRHRVLAVPVGQAASGWGKTVRPCPTNHPRQTASGYAPPCFAFTGHNGGATAPGVTARTIRVAYRMPDEPNLFSVFAGLAGVPYHDTADDMLRTTEGLVEYFNRNYQFYGRRIELVPYRGRGHVSQELMGAGQEEAATDAIQASREVRAFADVTALSQPYAEALSRQGVVNVGAVSMSSQWFDQQAPYAWSSFANCTTAAEQGARMVVEQLTGRRADRAGGALVHHTRRIGMVVPDNQEYQRCGDTGRRLMQAGGHAVDVHLRYVMDLNTLSTQADSVVSSLMSQGVTSVACGCDPLMLMNVVHQADERGYRPEWLLVGVGFADLDLVGQMVAHASGHQWDRAFGASPLASPPKPGTGEAYEAYRSVRRDEPAALVDLLYHQLLQLAIGIQMAGPDLTPATFEAGMFAYPGGDGSAGHWRFTPANRTGTADYREVRWDPQARSPFNGEPGTYTDDGTRHALGPPSVARH